MPVRVEADAWAIAAASRRRRFFEGHFGETKLDGLRFVILYAWPGPVYEGKGEMQAVIDERADAAQRKALLTMLTGGETDEAATHWWVFRAMSENLHEPLFRTIEFSVDIDGAHRRGHRAGRDPLDRRADQKPGQRRAAPGADRPARTASSSTSPRSATASPTPTAAIKLDLKNTYAQFNFLRHTGRGLVRER